MTNIFTVFVAALALGVAPFAQDTKQAETPNITGTWNMGLQGGHVIPVALTLAQKGPSVTGTILLPTQRAGDRTEVALKGELVDRALTLSGTVDAAAEPAAIEIAGTLNDDGSMEGTLKGPHGQVSWTAERLKARK
jgi:hypothetical protein